ncbi:hypothetical protein PGIGA_G00251490 [Pangasianodon gigas]|uniref:Uncharacterized protein n=1 Tax=Pangasianodon gigas TaxID=30993 RepID=A0ACC5WRC5_PANGG|nr:hypothetical protein [Pangasianodon gigas]
MRNVLQVCVFVSLALFITNEAVTVRRVFVPKEHFLLLSCDGQSDVEWRHGGTGLMNVNSTKQKFFSDGMLYISDIETRDSGLYYCNGRLIAHVTVLTGYDVVVCEGGTLYLRCTLPKQRWAFKHTAESKKEFISTRFKNGTVLKERPDPDSRFTHTSNHLQILNIQRLDSGTYFCSGKDIAAVTVTSGYDVVVCEGGTLYLRCTLPKQRWAFKHTAESKKEFISTRFKNGTVLKERPDPDSRFTHTSNHLQILNIQRLDSGTYFCSGKDIAAVTVTSGYDAVVCEGGTLYLRCTLPKQRWAFKHTAESKKEFISTRFKNGTVLKERPDPDSRFTHTSNHLQILNIQRLDSGTYFCSGKDIAAVTVTSESNTQWCPTAETTESGNNIPQKSGNVVLVAVLALCVLAVVTVVLLSVIMCLKFSSRKKTTASNPEESVQRLQKTHSTGAEAVTLQSADRLRSYNDEIHYASLGKQNWRARGWNQQSRQQVIYSTLLLTPKHTPTHTP